MGHLASISQYIPAARHFFVVLWQSESEVTENWNHRRSNWRQNPSLNCRYRNNLNWHRQCETRFRECFLWIVIIYAASAQPVFADRFVYNHADNGANRACAAISLSVINRYKKLLGPFIDVDVNIFIALVATCAHNENADTLPMNAQIFARESLTIQIFLSIDNRDSVARVQFFSFSISVQTRNWINLKRFTASPEPHRTHFGVASHPLSPFLFAGTAIGVIKKSRAHANTNRTLFIIFNSKQ